MVGGHLVNHDDIVQSFERVDLEALLADVLDHGLSRKVDELRSLPLIGGFLTEDRVADIRNSLVKGVLEHRETLLGKLEEAVEQGLDIQTLVREKVAAFPVEKLEQLVLDVASRELRSIEILGGVLGLIIGTIQAAVISFL